MRSRRQARGGAPGSTAAPDLSWHELVDEAHEVLAAEDLAPEGSFDLDDFRGRLGRARGLPIHLVPVDLGSAAAELCGLCVVTDQTATVFYSHSTTELYRLHNIVHELGHLLYGHRSVGPLRRPSMHQALAGSSRRTARWLSAQSGPTYDELAEAQADALGAALLGGAHEFAAHHWVATTALRGAAARLEAAVS